MLSFLQILIYIFRFNFNKTSKLLGQLSRNSYYVYILHMIVIGILAVILMKLSLPSIIKYFLLAILTFIFSNILVYGYRDIFHKVISMKSVMATILIVILLTIAFYEDQKNIGAGNQQLTTSDTNAIRTHKGLHEAAVQGDIEVVRQHINAGSNLNEMESSGGSSPLITAATFGKTEVARVLIDAGADVNFKNKEGSTALHAAAFFCNTGIVEILLDNGADINIRNKAGSTALQSVEGPFEEVKGIYDYFGRTLGPMGLELNHEQIKMICPRIAEILRQK